MLLADLDSDSDAYYGNATTIATFFSLVRNLMLAHKNRFSHTSSSVFRNDPLGISLF
jgi:hypothetical protein